MIQIVLNQVCSFYNGQYRVPTHAPGIGHAAGATWAGTGRDMIITRIRTWHANQPPLIIPSTQPWYRIEQYTFILWWGYESNIYGTWHSMAVSAVLLQQVECPVSLSRYEEWWLLPGISHHNGRNVVCSRPRTPPHVLIDTASSHQDNVHHSHSGPPSSTCHTKTTASNEG